MKVKTESVVVQPCPTLSDPMDHSLPGSSIHGIFQARVLEWGAIAFSDRKARGLQMEEISCKCQTFFCFSLKRQEETNFKCQIFGFPGGSVGKESPCNAGDPSPIPGLGRSPGEEIG